MVDWKELSKKAVDLTKDAADKSVETFNDWKDDPDRLSKVEQKKHDRLRKRKIKMEQKEQIKEAKRIQLKQEETFKQEEKRKQELLADFQSVKIPIKVLSCSHKQLKSKKAKLIQHVPGKIIISQKRNDLEGNLDDLLLSTTESGAGDSIFGAMLGGTTGAIVGSQLIGKIFYGTLKFTCEKGNHHILRFQAYENGGEALYRLLPHEWKNL